METGSVSGEKWRSSSKVMQSFWLLVLQLFYAFNLEHQLFLVLKRILFKCELPSKVFFSSQVDALMTNLLKLRNEDPTIKSLVVSQFTKFLNVLEVPLRYKLRLFITECKISNH